MRVLWIVSILLNFQHEGAVDCQHLIKLSTLLWFVWLLSEDCFL